MGSDKWRRQRQKRIWVGARPCPKASGPIPRPRRSPLSSSASRRAFPYAMIGATLTTRLAQDGIDKNERSPPSASPSWSTISNSCGRGSSTACGCRSSAGSGQRVSWMLVAGRAGHRGGRQPGVGRSLGEPAPDAPMPRSWSASAGATFDIVIDAYRIETLEAAPARRRVGHDPIWLAHRIGRRRARWRWWSRRASGWEAAYLACAVLRAAGDAHRRWCMGEPARHREPTAAARDRRSRRSGLSDRSSNSSSGSGALLVLLFILLHKIGDTLGQPDACGCCSTTSVSPMTRSRSTTSASASGPI